MTRDLEYNITAQDNGVTISDYLKKAGFFPCRDRAVKKDPGKYSFKWQMGIYEYQA